MMQLLVVMWNCCDCLVQTPCILSLSHLLKLKDLFPPFTFICQPAVSVFVFLSNLTFPVLGPELMPRCPNTNHLLFLLQKLTDPYTQTQQLTTPLSTTLLGSESGKVLILCDSVFPQVNDHVTPCPHQT